MSSIRKVCVAAVLATVASQEADAVQLKRKTFFSLTNKVSKFFRSGKTDKPVHDAGAIPTVQSTNPEQEILEQKCPEEKLEEGRTELANITEAYKKMEEQKKLINKRKEEQKSLEKQICEAETALLKLKNERPENYKKLKEQADLVDKQVDGRKLIEIKNAIVKQEKEVKKRSIAATKIANKERTRAMRTNFLAEKAAITNMQANFRGNKERCENAEHVAAIKNFAAMQRARKAAATTIQARQRGILARSKEAEEAKFNEVFGVDNFLYYSLLPKAEYHLALADLVKSGQGREKLQVAKDVEERYQALEAIYFAKLLSKMPFQLGRFELEEEAAQWAEDNFVSFSSVEEIKDKLVKLEIHRRLLSDDKVYSAQQMREEVKYLGRVLFPKEEFENEDSEDYYKYNIALRNKMEKTLQTYKERLQRYKEKSAALRTKMSAFEAFKNALDGTTFSKLEKGILMKGFDAMFHSTEDYNKIISAEQQRQLEKHLHEQYRDSAESVGKAEANVHDVQADGSDKKAFDDFYHMFGEAVRKDDTKFGEALRMGDDDEELYRSTMSEESPM